MKKILAAFFLSILLTGCSVVAGVSQNLSTEQPAFYKVNEVADIVNSAKIDNRPLIIFSSRDYTPFFAKDMKSEKEELFWVIPEDDFKPEDLVAYEKFLTEHKISFDLKLSAEGVTGKINGVPISIIPRRGIATIVTEKEPIVIADVDFFFRINRNRITQPKGLDVITFFRTLDEYSIKPYKFFLVRSLDINLPKWVQEFSYLIEIVFPYWLKKEVPYAVLALDEADRLINFAQYEDAYELLKQIEKDNEKNPYFFEKLFWVSIKTYRDNDLIAAAEKAYVLEPTMINLYLDGVDYLLEKNELYPALVLIKKAYAKEPWNRSVKAKFEEVIKEGYNYYNMHGEEELYRLFKEELEKLEKK